MGYLFFNFFNDKDSILIIFYSYFFIIKIKNLIYLISI